MKQILFTIYTSLPTIVAFSNGAFTSVKRVLVFDLFRLTRGHLLSIYQRSLNEHNDLNVSTNLVYLYRIHSLFKYEKLNITVLPYIL